MAAGKVPYAAAVVLCPISSLLWVGNTQCQAVPANIYSLGTLGSGSSDGYALNGFREVTGVSHTLTNEPHAFRYSGIPGSGGLMQDLGTLGGIQSRGLSINSAGQVAGYSTLPDGQYHAFRYDGTPGVGGIMYDLGTLAQWSSEAHGINDNSQVVGESLNALGNPHAFLYTGTPGHNGAMLDLGTLGGSGSFALDINNSGQVTGVADLKGSTHDIPHAFRYDGIPGAGGAMHDLGTLGGPQSWGQAINEGGQVTGWSHPGPSYGPFRAFRYDGTPGAGGVMRALEPLSTGESRGYDINDLGFVVGWAKRSASSGSLTATLWKPDLSVIDLDAWLDTVNPTLGARWQLYEAYGINNVGVITGSGYFVDDEGQGRSRAFVLDASSLIPEPVATSIGGASAMPALLRRRRRHADSRN